MATRKIQITCVACIVVLLDSIVREQLFIPRRYILYEPSP